MRRRGRSQPINAAGEVDSRSARERERASMGLNFAETERRVMFRARINFRLKEVGIAGVRVYVCG